MGDRANICVVDTYDDSKVYLYTHWDGTVLPVVLQKALAKQKRWEDPPYLTRIIFCTMVKGDEDGVIGFGISSELGDGGDRIIYVYVDRSPERSKVVIGDLTWSFKEYIDTENSILEYIW